MRFEGTMRLRAPLWLVFLVFVAAGAGAGAGEEPPPDPVRIEVQATRGRIIPQSKGGGGFERTFRFRAVPGEGNHWIRQELAVRGTVFDEEGTRKPVHLDVVEYYRVDSSGRTLQADSHYSQFWEARGGDLTITSTLTYGTLEAKKVGDTILLRSFILRGATDAEGEPVVMRKRTNREILPAERGERVTFAPHEGTIPTQYGYRVTWDARAGEGARTQPAGEIETGTWVPVLPAQTGPTRADARAQPIPELATRR